MSLWLRLRRWFYRAVHPFHALQGEGSWGETDYPPDLQDPSNPYRQNP